MKASIGSEQLPCVLAESSNAITLLLTADTIRRCNGSIADLRGRLSVHAAMRNLYFRAESGASAPRTYRENPANAGAEVRAR